MELYLAQRLFNDSSSSTSSSETDDEELILLAKGKRKIEIKVAGSVKRALFYNLDDFKSNFRVSRNVVENFLSDLQIDAIELSRGRPKVPVLDGMLLTLWILVSQESFRKAGERFSFVKGHSHTIFIKMCKIISSHAEKYIAWPKGDAAKQNIAKFNNLRGKGSFPNVMGCLDGTHIPIPGMADNSYRNRKGYHSVQLQCICNANQEFMDVFCEWPGAADDMEVWHNSSIYKKLKDNPHGMLPDQSYLLGDIAYPLETFLMVPYCGEDDLTEQEELFNQKLTETWLLIRESFSRLKGIFQRLQYLHILNVAYAKTIILTCCILHNVILQSRDESDEVFEIEDEEEEIDIGEHPENEEANLLRDSLMNQISGIK